MFLAQYRRHLAAGQTVLFFYRTGRGTRSLVHYISLNSSCPPHLERPSY